MSTDNKDKPNWRGFCGTLFGRRRTPPKDSVASHLRNPLGEKANKDKSGWDKALVINSIIGTVFIAGAALWLNYSNQESNRTQEKFYKDQDVQRQAASAAQEKFYKDQDIQRQTASAAQEKFYKDQDIQRQTASEKRDEDQKKDSARLARIDLATKLLPYLASPDPRIQKKALIILYAVEPEPEKPLFQQIIMTEKGEIDKGSAALDVLVALLDDNKIKGKPREDLDEARRSILAFQDRERVFVRIEVKGLHVKTKQEISKYLTGFWIGKDQILTRMAGIDQKSTPLPSYTVFRPEGDIDHGDQKPATRVKYWSNLDLLLLKIETPFGGGAQAKLSDQLPTNKEEVSIPGYTPTGLPFFYHPRILDVGPAEKLTPDVIEGTEVPSPIAKSTNVFTFEIPRGLTLSGAPVFNSKGEVIGMVAGTFAENRSKWYAIASKSILERDLPR